MTGQDTQDIDIIWLSLDRANNKYSSTSISMAAELAKSNRVFFINNPVTHFELAGKYIRRKHTAYTRNFSLVDSDQENLIVETPPVTLSINWLPKGTIHKSLLRYNNKLLFRFIGDLLKRHSIKRYILVNVFNPFFDALHLLPTAPLVSIYYSVDEIGFSPYLAKHGPWLESGISSKYDLVFTTSSALQQKFLTQTSKSFCLPNAADIEIFSKKSDRIPPELNGVTMPIAIYTGHTDWRMDIELITGVIRKSSDIFFLFVGPVSQSEETLSLLKSFPNVMFVGSKHLKELPDFLYHSSCAMIPYKRNELTRSIYPLKINEYLATGIPVVSTPFSEDIEQFADIIELADTVDSFHEKLHASILNNTEEKAALRVRRAEKNTWPERAQQFWKFIENEMKSD